LTLPSAARFVTAQRNTNAFTARPARFSTSAQLSFPERSFELVTAVRPRTTTGVDASSNCARSCVWEKLYLPGRINFMSA